MVFPTLTNRQIRDISPSKLPIPWIPDTAWAWGIGVHLELGTFVLDNLALLPPALQTLLRQNSHDYLYGCISADITLGKKYTHYLRHCHSWRMGKNILARITVRRGKDVAAVQVIAAAPDVG